MHLTAADKLITKTFCNRAEAISYNNSNKTKLATLVQQALQSLQFVT